MLDLKYYSERWKYLVYVSELLSKTSSTNLCITVGLAPDMTFQEESKKVSAFDESYDEE